MTSVVGASFGTQDVHKTWFLLPDGKIDEIDMAAWSLDDANRLAWQLSAKFFWRRLSQNLDDLSYNWGAYKAMHVAAKIEPFKVVRSPDSSGVEMLCRAKAGVT